jgi:hypothetical protein
MFNELMNLGPNAFRIVERPDADREVAAVSRKRMVWCEIFAVESRPARPTEETPSRFGRSILQR